ncbi:hypothetical protein COLU111180_10530 [Cohnella lubricantis]|uniref:Polymer-forming cytoskeletal protein n=1 Tax=Cohnella lubricantis TaxID=2163172 RepID=A0A841TB19_9BACL|nr:hypothetical protein [Cohnella lubricantis]MBB6678494.1 hypothetical protein [Cohnella lubricantis]MBP2118417.1 cytoskeletal protein CcmA (bactofilin family) [Cohnella lubricantis]
MSESMRLIGTTRSNGGKFGNVKIVGESELIGQTECESLVCTGTSQVKGDLKAGTVKLTGELDVEGCLSARRAVITGQANVRGNCRGENFKLMGELMVEGDFESEACMVTGAVKVRGLLNAEKLEIRLHGSSDAAEIGGGTILIKPSRGHRLKRVFAFGQSPILRANTIEGDRLDLEYTKAKVVRGNEVRIGPGCEIERVEYRQSLARGKGAQIGAEHKIDS